MRILEHSTKNRIDTRRRLRRIPRLKSRSNRHLPFSTLLASNLVLFLDRSRTTNLKITLPPTTLLSLPPLRNTLVGRTLLLPDPSRLLSRSRRSTAENGPSISPFPSFPTPTPRSTTLLLPIPPSCTPSLILYLPSLHTTLQRPTTIQSNTIRKSSIRSKCNFNGISISSFSIRSITLRSVRC